MNGEKRWRTVNVPTGLVDQIEKYLKTHDAKKKGFTSISSFISYILRKEFSSFKINDFRILNFSITT